MVFINFGTSKEYNYKDVINIRNAINKDINLFYTEDIIISYLGESLLKPLIDKYHESSKYIILKDSISENTSDDEYIE